jgi:hypothetical protein
VCAVVGRERGAAVYLAEAGAGIGPGSCMHVITRVSARSQNSQKGSLSALRALR